MSYNECMTQDTSIPYAVRRSGRARRLSITITHDGRVIVTLPRRGTHAQVATLVATHAVWIRRQIVRQTARPPRLIDMRSPAMYARYRARARLLVRDRVAHWGRILGVVPTRIVIRDQRSRWGSCSAAGTISINYRIVLLPPRLQDYLIVHELCHLRHMDHSPRFWAMVAATISNYRDMRQELRQVMPFMEETKEKIVQ